MAIRQLGFQWQIWSDSLEYSILSSLTLIQLFLIVKGILYHLP